MDTVEDSIMGAWINGALDLDEQDDWDKIQEFLTPGVNANPLPNGFLGPLCWWILFGEQAHRHP